MPPKIVAVNCIGLDVGMVGPDSDGLSINNHSFPAMSKIEKGKGKKQRMETVKQNKSSLISSRSPAIY